MIISLNKSQRSPAIRIFFHVYRKTHIRIKICLPCFLIKPAIEHKIFERAASQLKRSRSQLEKSESEPQRSGFQLKRLRLQLERFGFKLERSLLEMERSRFQLERLGYRLEKSPLQLRRLPFFHCFCLEKFRRICRNSLFRRHIH